MRLHRPTAAPGGSSASRTHHRSLRSVLVKDDNGQAGEPLLLAGRFEIGAEVRGAFRDRLATECVQKLITVLFEFGTAFVPDRQSSINPAVRPHQITDGVLYWPRSTRCPGACPRAIGAMRSPEHSRSADLDIIDRIAAGDPVPAGAGKESSNSSQPTATNCSRPTLVVQSSPGSRSTDKPASVRPKRQSSRYSVYAIL